MAREIKFRAWDKKWKRWILPEDINFYGEMGWIISRRAEANGDKIESVDLNDEFHLMQFTGLKDNRGKEIFEGDIVTIYEGKPCEVKHGMFSSYDHDDGSNSGYGFFYDAGKERQYPVSWFLDAVKIIGNIHENPELLK